MKPNDEVANAFRPLREWAEKIIREREDNAKSTRGVEGISRKSGVLKVGGAEHKQGDRADL